MIICLTNFFKTRLKMYLECFNKSRKVVSYPLTIPLCLVVTNLGKNWPIFLFGNEQMDKWTMNSDGAATAQKEELCRKPWVPWVMNLLDTDSGMREGGTMGMSSICVQCTESVWLGKWNESIRVLHNPITSCHAWHVHDTSAAASQAGNMWSGVTCDEAGSGSLPIRVSPLPI